MYKRIASMEMKRQEMSSTTENVDRLSNLPRELLSHILSLMPTKFAMRTSVLSKNWRYVWKLLTNLDFSGLDYCTSNLISFGYSDCFFEFVDRVLEHHKAFQVNILRLRLRNNSFSHSRVSKWISDAVMLNVGELDIFILVHGLVELSYGLFTLKSLKKLKLQVDGFMFKVDVDVLKFSSSVNLPSLKTLDISSLGKPPVNAFKLIHGCPLLENLSLTVSWCSKEEEYVFNIPTLKRLKLVTRYSNSVINKVVLDVPKLEHLFVGGTLCPFFVMKDLTSLVEATVLFSEYNYLWLELLHVISRAKSLSLAKPLDVPHRLSLPKFPNLKYLDLKVFLRSRRLLILQFIENSSELEHLCVEEMPGAHYIESEEICWSIPQLVPTCMLTNLRTMKLANCRGENRDIQFIEYMLGNAVVLKNLTYTRGFVPHGQEMYMFSKLLKLPRASIDCEILFIGEYIHQLGSIADRNYHPYDLWDVLFL